MSLYFSSQTFRENTLKILEYLSVNKEIEQYKIKDLLGCKYRQSFRHFNPLRHIHLVSFVEHKPSRKRGKDKNIWRINLLGLEVILSEKNELLDEYDKIAETHKEKLPLIFGNKELFKTISLYSSEELARARITINYPL